MVTEGVYRLVDAVVDKCPLLQVARPRRIPGSYEYVIPAIHPIPEVFGKVVKQNTTSRI